MVLNQITNHRKNQPMKTRPIYKMKLMAFVALIAAFAPSLHAQLTFPTTDVSDGALNITVSTNIDLRNAVTVNNWTNSNTGPNVGNGVYDPAQWAVVFKYSSVYIASNTTVSFINHQTHAPVVWLVNGNVTINGTLNLDGLGSTSDPNNLPEPGPGGFRGGAGPNGNGAGFGPGGGVGGYIPPGYYGSYGNAQILPLIGGSGGSGYAGGNGGAGGGAILIAATGNMNLTNAYLHANGGNGNNYYNSGSGGAIRLVANQISGNSSSYIRALAQNGGGLNAPGRIRLEANSVIGPIDISPNTAGTLPDSPVKIFPDTNAPIVMITSVAGITNGLTDPKAIMSSGVNADDVTLVTTNDVTIRLRTQNFPTNGTVSVYIKPRNSLPQTVLTAIWDSGTTNSALWHVNTTLLYPGYAAHTVIQARASF
jgi:hypothetical protein